MRKIKNKLLLVGLSAIMLVSGCSIQPKLYPNDHYMEVGKSQADQDIAECEYLAEMNGPSGAQVAWEIFAGTTATGAVVGGSGSGRYADAYAIENSGPSSEENEKRFIETCLKKKGYDVTGWELA